MTVPNSKQAKKAVKVNMHLESIPEAVADVPSSFMHPNYTQYAGSPSKGQESELRQFHENFQAHYEQYVMVGIRAKVPASLVAALHWREGSGSFHTYLHQGDRLGRPAKNEPNNIPIFPDTMQGWEGAAVHAIGMKEDLRVKMGITLQTTDLNALCDFAEHYNGLGSRNKGLPSAYVLAGTEGYKKGKYVADHIWDPNFIDQQLGVLLMLRAAYLS